MVLFVLGARDSNNTYFDKATRGVLGGVLLRLVGVLLKLYRNGPDNRICRTPPTLKPGAPTFSLPIEKEGRNFPSCECVNLFMVFRDLIANQEARSA